MLIDEAKSIIYLEREILSLPIGGKEHKLENKISNKEKKPLILVCLGGGEA